MNKEIREAIIQQDIAALEKVCRGKEGKYHGDKKSHMDILRSAETRGEFDHMSLFVKNEALSMDVGACGGAYAIKLAACTKKCIVIEPSKESSNLKDILPPNCVFLNIAVGDARGTAQLTAPIFDGNTSHGQATLLDFWGAEFETVAQETQVRTIDDILEEVCPEDFNPKLFVNNFYFVPVKTDS